MSKIKEIRILVRGGQLWDQYIPSHAGKQYYSVWRVRYRIGEYWELIWIGAPVAVHWNLSAEEVGKLRGKLYSQNTDERDNPVEVSIRSCTDCGREIIVPKNPAQDIDRMWRDGLCGQCRDAQEQKEAEKRLMRHE